MKLIDQLLSLEYNFNQDLHIVQQRSDKVVLFNLIQTEKIGLQEYNQ